MKTVGGCCYVRGMKSEKSAGQNDTAPRTHDRVQAHLFNYDGRREHMYPPDVDDPEELLIGTLYIEGVDSAWGGYTRHAVILDDGAFREVEPDTIVLISRAENGDV